MAANNASKITKTLSKLVSPPIGSPKKPKRSKALQATSGINFKKPFKPSPLSLKTVKAVEPTKLSTVRGVKSTVVLTSPAHSSSIHTPKNDEKFKVVKSTLKRQNAVKEENGKELFLGLDRTPFPKVKPSGASKVNILNIRKGTPSPQRQLTPSASSTGKAKLAVPTPSRRPPSIPLATWNADHLEIVKATPKLQKTVGETKKNQLAMDRTPMPKIKTSATAVKTVPTQIIRKSSQVKTSKSVKSLKPTVVISNPQPAGTIETSTQNEATTPSKHCAELAFLDTEISALKKKLNSIGNSKYKSLNDPRNNKSTQLNETTVNQNDLGMSSGMKENLPPFTASTMDISNTIDLKTNYSEFSPKAHSSLASLKSISSPRGGLPGNNITSSFGQSLPQVFEEPYISSPKVRSRRSLDSISSAIENLGGNSIKSPFGRSLPQVNEKTEDNLPSVWSQPSRDRISPRRSLSGEKPWSPFGQPVPRVFERQYDNFADALFAPYLTED